MEAIQNSQTERGEWMVIAVNQISGNEVTIRTQAYSVKSAVDFVARKNKYNTPVRAISPSGKEHQI